MASTTSIRRACSRHRLVTAAVVSGTALAVVAVAPNALAAVQPRHQLPGGKPAWTGHAQLQGNVPSSSSVSFSMLLNMRNPSGAAAQIQQLSDPHSASYKKWLSNAQFTAEYAPTAASVSAVTAWLKSQHLSVTDTLPSGMLIEASGSAADVEKAFGTGLQNYTYRSDTVQANTTTPSLPAGTPSAVVSAVRAVVGLDQGSDLASPGAAAPGPPPGARYGVQPCSSYFGQKLATDKPKAYGKTAPYAVCGYVPQQFQSAYGVAPYLAKGIDGRGVTVAITDAYASPTLLADAQKYNVVHDQPQFKAGQFTEILPKNGQYNQLKACGGNGWYGEQTLDVESVHAMAPGANIVYVGAKNCGNGLDNAWASAIDNHVADIVTDSWTFGAADSLAQVGQSAIDFFQQYSTEAALTGMTVNFSSGDDGDNTAGGTNPTQKTVEFPADLPYVTGVGGTSLAVGAKGQRTNEWGWSNAYSQLTNGAWTPTPPGTYSSGAGGGTSQLFDQPFYQRGVVPTSLSEYYGSTPARTVPDVAMDADPNTGIEVGETQVFPDGTYWDQYRIGGTSVASPLLAGAFAVADEISGKPLGFVNPVLYELSGTSALFDEVPPTQPVTQVRTNYVNGVDNSQGKSYELQTIDYEGTTLHTARGYDDITGVGSPGGSQFYSAVATGHL